MSNPIVEVKHLSHRYSVDWAIRDINFSIEKTGILGLLGSNGAGKSTTMNIICGVLNQTEGDVFINGIDLRKNPVEAKKHIGFLPQKPPLHPDLTVDEYLIHCATLRRMEIVEIRNLIKEIAEDHSVLLSTHILSEVQATCNDIRMIEHGKVVFSGSMKDFDNYVVPSSFTVTFALPPSIEELAKIEHVLNIEELYPGTFRIRFDDDENITERVVALSIQNGWRLKEITMERCSLDIIFAQLSGKLKNNI